MVIRRQQLERRALLTVQRTVGKRGADSRLRWEGWCEKAVLDLLSLRLQLLFPLCTPVLEPNLHLSLGEAQGRGNAVPLQHWQVVAPLEAVLQHLQLLQTERSADPTTLGLRAALASTWRPLLRPAASTRWRSRHSSISGGISWNSQIINESESKATLNQSSESLTCLTCRCCTDFLRKFFGIQNILHGKRRSVDER